VGLGRVYLASVGDRVCLVGFRRGVLGGCDEWGNDSCRVCLSHFRRSVDLWIDTGSVQPLFSPGSAKTKEDDKGSEEEENSSGKDKPNGIPEPGGGASIDTKVRVIKTVTDGSEEDKVNDHDDKGYDECKSSSKGSEDGSDFFWDEGKDECNKGNHYY
jgi:hypothetical protein